MIWYIKNTFIDSDSLIIRWIKIYSSMKNSEISFNIYVPVMQKNQIFTKTILVARKEIKKETYEMFLLSIQIRRNSKIKWTQKNADLNVHFSSKNLDTYTMLLFGNVVFHMVFIIWFRVSYLRLRTQINVLGV